jgi:thiol-disulfide isomerase/thioredoxin
MMWIPLLWISFTATPQVDVAALQAQVEELRQRSKDESYLLNQSITLPALSFWDGLQQGWRTPEGKLDQPTPSKVRILHIWATYCAPCKEEFPILREMDRQLRKDYHGEVLFTYVAVDIRDSEAMKQYWVANNLQMPVGPMFGDHNDGLTRSLAEFLPQKPQKGAGDPGAMARRLPLPMTLVLDEEGVVRQALVGSIASRRAELVNGVAQVYRWVKGHQGLLLGGAKVKPAKLVAKSPRPDQMQ